MNGAAIKPASVTKIKSGLFALANSETAAAVNETPAQKLIRKYGRLRVSEHSGVGVGALGGIAIGATPQAATLAKLAPLIQKMQDDELLAKSEHELHDAELRRFRTLQIERRKQERAAKLAAERAGVERRKQERATKRAGVELSSICEAASQSRSERDTTPAELRSEDVQLRTRIARVGTAAVLAEMIGEQRSEQARNAIYNFVAGKPLRYGDVIVPALETVEARVRDIVSHNSTRCFRVVRIVRAGNLRNVEVASIAGR